MHDIYGLKSAGAAFWIHLSDYMHNLVFLPCPDDLDLLMKHMVRTDYGFNYYADVLMYVDGIMFIRHDSESV